MDPDPHRFPLILVEWIWIRIGNEVRDPGVQKLAKTIAKSEKCHFCSPKPWIRILIETNADPQHWYQLSHPSLLLVNHLSNISALTQSNLNLTQPKTNPISFCVESVFVFMLLDPIKNDLCVH